MKIFVIDNGERYSDHVIWFVEDSGVTREQVELFLKIADGPEPYKVCKVLGHGEFGWYEGKLSTFEAVFESRWRWSDWPADEFGKLTSALPPPLASLLTRAWPNAATVP